jgi:RHS repeat-associated protein
VSTNNQGYQYDGFGNLTSKTLGSAATPIAVNAVTNRLSNAGYDFNGNMTSGAGVTLSYDVSNRVASAMTTNNGSQTEYYGYGPDNKRMWKQKADETEEWTFYGAKGEKIGVYQLSDLSEAFNNQGVWQYDTRSFLTLRTSVWFDGRLVQENGAPVYADRLGTNRTGGAKYTSYGEEIGTATANDRTKFGTYNRDGFTGLDYADQRFYASTYGRFTSPDPYKASGGAKDPGSWNRYAYAGGDPINYNDPRGLVKCKAIGSYTTRPDPNDALKEVIYTELQCTSAGGTITFFGGWVELAGTREQLEKDAEAAYGKLLDLQEQSLTLGFAGSTALAALTNPQCSGLFQGGDPSRVLQSLLDGGAMGKIQFGDLGPPRGGFVTAASTSGVLGRSAQGTSIFTGANITINSNSAAPWLGGYPGGFGVSDNVHRAITLIHELGHVFHTVTGLGNSSLNNDDAVTDAAGNAVSAGTDRTILEKCFPADVP